MNNWKTYFEKSNRNIFKQCLSARRLIEILIDTIPGDGRVLEAGCGTALLSLLLADYGFDVTALDLTDEIIDYAKKRICVDNVKLKIMKGDIFRLSSLFEERYFDVVCNSGVMEHFQDEDIVRGLVEQKKVSKKVIFNVPNNRNVLTEGHFGDERFLCNRKWVSLIKNAGFKSVRVYGGYYVTRPAYLLPGIVFKHGFYFDFLWKYFSRHSVFVCE
ncbi:MAG: class I SAM-dependent methyltransferase [Planctomycetes bacterium]|nr:class I SAM-dependent methyltransferase [Planctomycetota bacterium]